MHTGTVSQPELRNVSFVHLLLWIMQQGPLFVEKPLGVWNRGHRTQGNVAQGHLPSSSMNDGRFPDRAPGDTQRGA